MSNSINLDQIVTVAKALKDLKDEVVFVGGSTTALLVDGRGLGKARQTEDVDFIVDISFRSDLPQFEDRMRKLGFRHDTSEGAPICRWLIDFRGGDLKVDAMPANEDVLGFTNKWYKDAIETAGLHDIEKGLTINVVSPVYFLGTKFEAFQGRGKGSIFSHDLEDVFYVLEHRARIDMDVYEAKDDIKYYLKDQFRALLLHPDIDNSLPGMVDHEDSVITIIRKMEFISKLE